VICISQNSPDTRKKQQVSPPLDPEELYQRYLSVRAERNRLKKEHEYPVTELKKADSGNILL
jgi:hypothetical protein